MLEPDADWNGLMGSPVQDIQGLLNVLGGGLTFFPGDALNFTLENGTSIETFWIAIYTNPYFTGPLSTGGDFFNYFVLGQLPASFDDTPLPPAFNDTSDDSNDGDEIIIAPTDRTIPFNISFSYPDNPVVVQTNWAVSGGGVITGYFLDDIATGVLSIPSFNEFGSDIGTFSDSIDAFISQAQQAQITKVIIDLQQNAGGFVELSFTTFGQFFPGQTPFAGSRRRSHLLGNMLGETFTAQFAALAPGDPDTDDLEASEWVITDRLRASTGHNFSSWDEYLGPLAYDGDLFTLTVRIRKY